MLISRKLNFGIDTDTFSRATRHRLDGFVPCSTRFQAAGLSEIEPILLSTPALSMFGSTFPLV